MFKKIISKSQINICFFIFFTIWLFAILNSLNIVQTITFFCLYDVNVPSKLTCAEATRSAGAAHWGRHVTPVFWSCATPLRQPLRCEPCNMALTMANKCRSSLTFLTRTLSAPEFFTQCCYHQKVKKKQPNLHVCYGWVFYLVRHDVPTISTGCCNMFCLFVFWSKYCFDVQEMLDASQAFTTSKLSLVPSVMVPSTLVAWLHHPLSVAWHRKRPKAFVCFVFLLLVICYFIWFY